MKEYKPLIIWLVIIFIMTYLISHIYYNYPMWSMMDMNILMWVRFIIFWVMKLFDIEWFASMFGKYDPIAKIFSWYGYIFPFLEVIIWIIYIYDQSMIYRLPTNIIAATITWITSIWISIALYKEEKDIKCVCTGSEFNTPLWRPSLIEQLSMCIMAIYMLYIMI